MGRTKVSVEPLPFLFRSTSRKANFFSFSMVNWMDGLKLLRCTKSSSTASFLMMQKVSSTYLFHLCGGVGGVEIASCSKIPF